MGELGQSFWRGAERVVESVSPLRPTRFSAGLFGRVDDEVLGAESSIPVSSKLIEDDLDPLKGAANKVRPISGYYDVVVHGKPDAFSVLHNGKWVDINHRSLVTFIKKSGYKGEPVRLVSCKTGSCSVGIAQDLANKLKQEVIAPSDTLWIHPSGRLTIGKTPLSNTGSWEKFIPDVKNLFEEKFNF